jgi:hypothetical protein
LFDIQLFLPAYSTVSGTDGRYRKLMTKRRFILQSMSVRTSSFAPRRLGRSGRRLLKVAVSFVYPPVSGRSSLTLRKW